MNNLTHIDLSSKEGVDLSPNFLPMLNDMQANILKGHGRSYAYHIFLELKEDNIQEAKGWIANFALKGVTSAKQQLEAREIFKKTGIDGGSIYGLSLSASGYQKLGIAESRTPADQQFRDGLKQSAGKLNDEPENWDDAFSNAVDVLIIVGDDSPFKAQLLADGLAAQVSGFSTVVLSQKGKILNQKVSDKFAINIEHFGYADGVSQPIYLKDEIAEQAGNQHWFDAEPLSLVLVQDTGGASEESFGSYLVFRKLDQNVREFKLKEAQLPAVQMADSNGNDELAGAMMVGRFENSTTTLLSDTADTITNSSQIINDFNYSTDAPGSASNGSKCPFHSHVRITNPRSDVGDFAHTVRLTRRGIPYDDINRFGDPDTIQVTEEQLDNNQPTGDIGLLFMCYQSSISRQFEFIQSTWANEGDIGGRAVGQDGIIGQGNNGFQKTLPGKWGQIHPQNNMQFSGMVKMRGGEYFFTPSISFLQSLSPATTLAEMEQYETEA